MAARPLERRGDSKIVRNQVRAVSENTHALKQGWWGTCAMQQWPKCELQDLEHRQVLST